MVLNQDVPKVAVYDIEGDGLLDTVSTVHCAWLWSSIDNTYYGYPPNRIPLLADDLNHFDVVSGHNILGYDNEAIHKVLGKDITRPSFDTLVGARFLFPDMQGGHSLKQWGRRLNVHKIEYGEVEDDAVDVWSEFNWEMYWYCKGDVKTTVALYKMLLSKGLDPRDLLETYVNWEACKP